MNPPARSDEQHLLKCMDLWSGNRSVLNEASAIHEDSSNSVRWCTRRDWSQKLKTRAIGPK